MLLEVFLIFIYEVNCKVEKKEWLAYFKIDKEYQLNLPANTFATPDQCLSPNFYNGCHIVLISNLTGITTEDCYPRIFRSHEQKLGIIQGMYSEESEKLPIYRHVIREKTKSFFFAEHCNQDIVEIKIKDLHAAGENFMSSGFFCIEYLDFHTYKCKVYGWKYQDRDHFTMFSIDTEIISNENCQIPLGPSINRKSYLCIKNTGEICPSFSEGAPVTCDIHGKESLVGLLTKNEQKVLDDNPEGPSAKRPKIENHGLLVAGTCWNELGKLGLRKNNANQLKIWMNIFIPLVSVFC